MKKSFLGKVFVAMVTASCLLMQGCFEEKPVEWVEPNVSVSVSSTVQAEKADSTETSTSISKEEASASTETSTETSTEASTEEPVPEPEVKEERPEGVFLRLTQNNSEDPLVIDLYEDGSYVAFPKKNPAEKDEGYWNYNGGKLGLAAEEDQFVVNEFSLGEAGFTYVGYGSSGFPQRLVKDKDFFSDSERVMTAVEFEKYQEKLGGAPFHARFPSVYAKTDDIFLGSWKDASGMFAVSFMKASAEIGGYSFTIKDVLGNELGSGDAMRDGDKLVMIQGSGSLSGTDCSAEKSDEGIAISLDSAALVNYGIPAGDTYEIHLTR